MDGTIFQGLHSPQGGLGDWACEMASEKNLTHVAVQQHAIQYKPLLKGWLGDGDGTQFSGIIKAYILEHLGTTYAAGM